MKKIVFIIIIVSVFSYFAFPIFWGADRQDISSQFVYDEFVKMSEMDPFDFFASKIFTPVLSYCSDVGDRAIYYINLGVGTVLYGQDYSETLGSYSDYKAIDDALEPILDDLNIGIFQGSLFDYLEDLVELIFGGNK